MSDFVFSMMMLGALSSGGTLPFWAVSDQYGLMPGYGGTLALVQAARPFDQEKTFQWHAGASLAALWQPVQDEAPGSSPYSAIVDELYAGVRWKVLRADFGMIHREAEFLAADPRLGSLSVTQGHIVESGNARSMPGYSLVLEPWAVPFTGGHLKISGLWGDYKTLDGRYMAGALVHRMRAYLTYEGGRHFWIQAGLDHYALWGGESPSGLSMEVNLDNYLRVVTGRSASASGTKSDQMNVIGDHGGAEQLRMGWREKDWKLVFQWDKPYSDKSGMRLNNIPDGVYSLYFDLADKDRWLSGALLEFHYTMWQSGTLHERETDANGEQIDWHKNRSLNIFGGDNYYTNSEYKSGWTYFGRAICSPLFFTKTGSNGVTAICNTRHKALHLGLSGKLFRKAPWRLMLTASDNYGTYSSPFISPSTWATGWNWWEKNTVDKGLKQFSAAFTGFVPFTLSHRLGLDVMYGLYADRGEYLKNNLGATLGVRLTL